ncbi:hypothetical protein I6N91_16785 [Arthrobacter sp. MSA 4-2]|uniref:hypothetical protein n=1 Tax=Arthrobacter sp. MSA 4-2 TaxID=2794349 RepID=UPI0018E8FCDA|nr:hypothetical protein [Arthrobacter sp. MSA 4-2]MBJ2122635.1 hypothetical protein [Arthrobacter sp. MSA 4-2]
MRRNIMAHPGAVDTEEMHQSLLRSDTRTCRPGTHQPQLPGFIAEVTEQDIPVQGTGLNAADAFKRISQYSQRTNRKVVVSSQQIIDRAQQLNGQDKHQSSTGTLLDLFQVLRNTTQIPEQRFHQQPERIAGD